MSRQFGTEFNNNKKKTEISSFFIDSGTYIKFFVLLFLLFLLCTLNKQHCVVQRQLTTFFFSVYLNSNL